MKSTKANEKYGVYGLTKVDGVTMLNGHTINDYPSVTVTHLANYGMFVETSRTHAASKDCPLTEKEKADAFKEMDDWYMAGCPKREKAERIDKFTDACRKVLATSQSDKLKASTIKVLEEAYGRTWEGEE